jgi:hypothetical protein
MGAEQAEELSRGEVLLKGAAVVGGLYGLAAVGPYVDRALGALGSVGGGDVGLLNYLLPFEYLQVSLYNRASTEKGDRGEKMPLGAKETELLSLFQGEDGQHVVALQKLIEEMGGEPVKKKSYAFAFRTFRQVLNIAIVLEETSVRAYNGALSKLESAEARERVYSIVQTDARHNAAVRIGNGEPPTLEAFDFAVPETDSIAHLVPYTGEYEEEFLESG